MYSGDACGDAGGLGTVSVDDGGRAILQTISQQLHVWDLIGRSIVVHSSQNRYILCSLKLPFLLLNVDLCLCISGVYVAS